MKLLPNRRPGLEASDLRARLEEIGYAVSKRTIERDLNELSAVFPVECNDKSIPYGWHLIPGKPFDMPGMDLNEAMSLGLLQDLMCQLLPKAMSRSLDVRFDQATRKLQALPRNGRAKWKDLCRYVPPGIPFQPPSVDNDVMEAVCESLLERRQLEVKYRGAEADEFKTLVLHPLGLIQQGERSYVVATTFDYERVVHYAVHRIGGAEVLESPSKRPKGFDLGGYIEQGGGQFGEGERITLRASISDHLARILEETPVSTDQKITGAEGAKKLVATVVSSWQLQFWILSQGAAITVTRPASLKKAVVNTLESALSNYRS